MSVDASITIHRHGQVRAVLADTRFAVPAVPVADGGGLAWLRAHVSRFSDGADHRRRRGLATGALAGVSPAALRRAAHERTVAVLSGNLAPLDVMARLARTVPLGVLAEALGVGEPIAADVAVVAVAYVGAVPGGPAADRAVGRLVRSFGGVPDEPTAARIGLLVQACDAVAGLIGNCLLAAGEGRHREPVEALLRETLRYDPPVRGTRRVCRVPARIGPVPVAAGTLVRLDFAAANRDPEVFRDPDRFDPARFDPAHAGRERHLTFGAGPRPCPGDAQALALAAGVVEPLLGYRLVDAEVDRDPAANLRVPVRLVVAAG